jgi:polyisoprenyl-phosphate glycosyltransferase
MKNSGQTRATMTGINLASGEIVITMDDDLQHDPQLIPRLLEELKKDSGYDCVFAYFPEKKHAAYRNIASKIISWINARAFGDREIRISSFRMMRGYIAQIIRQNQSNSATVGGLILANTSKVKYVPIPHHERFHGKSNYTVAKQLKIALDNICSVSMLPLRMISATGLMAATLSGFLLCYFLLKYLTGGITQPGWTSLVTLITFFSGLILLSLGVIGEYLVRVLRELQNTNITMIRQSIGFRSNKDLIDKN